MRNTGVHNANYKPASEMKAKPNNCRSRVLPEALCPRLWTVLLIRLLPCLNSGTKCTKSWRYIQLDQLMVHKDLEKFQTILNPYLGTTSTQKYTCISWEIWCTKIGKKFKTILKSHLNISTGMITKKVQILTPFQVRMKSWPKFSSFVLLSHFLQRHIALRCKYTVVVIVKLD